VVLRLRSATVNEKSLQSGQGEGVGAVHGVHTRPCTYSHALIGQTNQLLVVIQTIKGTDRRKMLKLSKMHTESAKNLKTYLPHDEKR
jgi:hypothetical protein